MRSETHSPRLFQLTGSVAHDPDYRAAKKDFEKFVETLTPKIAGVDGTVPELPVKDLVVPTLMFSFCVPAIDDCPRSFAFTETFDSARILFRTRYPSTRLQCPKCSGSRLLFATVMLVSGMLTDE